MEKLQEDRKLIINKGYGAKWEKKFFIDIQEAVIDGFRIAETGKREDACMRNYKGTMGKAVLYKTGDVLPSGENPLAVTVESLEAELNSLKEDMERVLQLNAELQGQLEAGPTLTPPEEVIVPEELIEPSNEDLLEELSNLTKKDQLVEFAEKNKLDIEEGIIVPSAIKKHLKEKLSENT